ESAASRDDALVGPEARRPAVRALRRVQAARAIERLQAARLADDVHVIPQRVGDYDILEEVGRGGMGVVYKARHRDLDRLAALKMVLAGEFASPSQELRFRLEAQLAARVQHANIVQVYEVGSYQGRPFLAMEWVEGGSLADQLDGTPWPPGKAAEFLQILARAVHEAHREGVVHRDLKPANILLKHDATSGDPLLARPKISDFGLARPTDGAVDLTQSGFLIGTPGYMAPEQAGGRGARAVVGPATDIYALGVILYQLLTGQLPFQAESTLELLRAVAIEEPRRPRRIRPGLPRDLEAVTLHCLEKEPTARYASALALAEDLRRFLEKQPVTARPVGAFARATRAARRRPLVAALAGLLVTTLLGGLGGVTWKWLEADEQRQLASDYARRADTERLAALHQTYRARLSAAASALAAHDVGNVARQLDAAPETLRDWEWSHFHNRLDDSAAVVPLAPNGTAVLLPGRERCVSPSWTRAAGSPTSRAFHPVAASRCSTARTGRGGDPARSAHLGAVRRGIRHPGRIGTSDLQRGSLGRQRASVGNQPRRSPAGRTPWRGKLEASHALRRPDRHSDRHLRRTPREHLGI
ncbi:MAG: serine/threonine-protein kinase, partial [Isosphaeraceae bacterium]